MLKKKNSNWRKNYITRKLLPFRTFCSANYVLHLHHRKKILIFRQALYTYPFPILWMEIHCSFAKHDKCRIKGSILELTSAYMSPRNESFAECKTPGSEEVGRFEFRMKFDSKEKAGVYFTYMEDPIVSSVHSGGSQEGAGPRSIASGGILIKVEGEHFQSVFRPSICFNGITCEVRWSHDLPFLFFTIAPKQLFVLVHLLLLMRSQVIQVRVSNLDHFESWIILRHIKSWICA